MLYIVNGACAAPNNVLFDTCADPISFVNRKIATWIRNQRRRYGEHDENDSKTMDIVALAGISMTSSTYGSVSFNLAFFNEINELNETIISIKAKVIDSCIEVIRSHHLICKIPSYFDEIESRCQSNQEARPVSKPICNACHSCAHPRCQHSHAKQMGIETDQYSIWMTRSDQSPDPIDGKVCCSAVPSANSQLLETYDLIEKGDVLDSIDDDDDIEWPENPFGYREDQGTETTEELLAMILFDGSVGFQAKLRKLREEYINIFSTKVRHQSAKV